MVFVGSGMRGLLGFWIGDVPDLTQLVRAIPGHQKGSSGWMVVGSMIAAFAATGDGSDVAMSGMGMWDPGAIGSRDGREVVVWFGSSGESGVVIGRPSSSYETSYCGGGEGGR